MVDRVYEKSYEVIVVGAGHAGSEAALAAVRFGCSTLLFTINMDTISHLPGSPAFVDYPLLDRIEELGGEMPHNVRRNCIHLDRELGYFKSIVDKRKYNLNMKYLLEKREGLDIKQDIVTSLLAEDGKIRGIKTIIGIEYRAKAVILATGTFLRGVLHLGESLQSGGRDSEFSADELSRDLRELRLRLRRGRRSSPSVVDISSIDRSVLKEIPSLPLGKGGFLPCWLLEGEREIILEPESYPAKEFYLGKLSDELHLDGEEGLRRLPGFTEVKFVKSGYEVEYDQLEAGQLKNTLEFKSIGGLFAAGEFIGRTTYESAALQGLIAGANAAWGAKGGKPIYSEELLPKGF